MLSAIGAVCAVRVASEGAKLVIDARTVSKMKDTVMPQIKKGKKAAEVIAVEYDAADEEDVKGSVNRAVEEYKKLAIAVNNNRAAVDMLMEFRYLKARAHRRHTMNPMDITQSNPNN